MIKPWSFAVSPSETTRYGGRVFYLKDGRGRTRATIWERERPRPNVERDPTLEAYTWHTWDENGTGGENCAADTLNRAKDEVIAAIVRQGWAPGGWEVAW